MLIRPIVFACVSARPLVLCQTSLTRDFCLRSHILHQPPGLRGSMTYDTESRISVSPTWL